MAGTVANIAALKAMVKPGDEPHLLEERRTCLDRGRQELTRHGMGPDQMQDVAIRRVFRHAQMGAVGLRGLPG